MIAPRPTGPAVLQPEHCMTIMIDMELQYPECQLSQDGERLTVMVTKVALVAYMVLVNEHVLCHAHVALSPFH